MCDEAEGREGVPRGAGWEACGGDTGGGEDCGGFGVLVCGGGDAPDCGSEGGGADVGAGVDGLEEAGAGGGGDGIDLDGVPGHESHDPVRGNGLVRGEVEGVGLGVYQAEWESSSLSSTRSWRTVYHLRKSPFGETKPRPDQAFLYLVRTSSTMLVLLKMSL